MKQITFFYLKRFI